MTSDKVNSFVGDLVAMAQAYEQLPQVREELSTVRGDIDRAQATIQRLELKLIERANEIDSLNARIRSLEVERDDAQFQAMEADDRKERALDFIKATFGNAGSLIQALEPAKPEPVKAEEPQVPLAGDPNVYSVPQPGTVQLTGSVSSSEVSGEGQREPDPTSGSVDTARIEDTASTTAHVDGSKPTPLPEPVLVNDHKPYANKRYYDHPSYVTLTDWLAGGGSEEDYNWRPGLRPNPVF